MRKTSLFRHSEVYAPFRGLTALPATTGAYQLLDHWLCTMFQRLITGHALIVKASTTSKGLRARDGLAKVCITEMGIVTTSRGQPVLNFRGRKGQKSAPLRDGQHGLGTVPPIGRTHNKWLMALSAYAMRAITAGGSTRIFGIRSSGL